jgi:hypothetical protein
MIRRLLVVLALGSLLTACGLATTPAPTVAVQQPTAAPSAAAPTTAPTAQPPAVTAAPTSEPIPTAALPAPLYVLEGGQVVRIDVDSTTKTTLTVDWLIPTLHKSIRKLLCFNMCQLDITMDWAKERNTITNQNRYSRNNEVSDKPSVQEALDSLPAINVKMACAICGQTCHEVGWR